MKLQLYSLVLFFIIIADMIQAQQPDTLVNNPSKDEQLLIAADAGDTVKALQLIKSGADVDVATVEGVTPLMYATQIGNLPMMQLLIHSGADPDKKPSNGYTALIASIRNGQPDLAEFLILHGASVDLADNDNASPLMHAIIVDSFYFPDMLLYYGADFDTQRHDGMDALMLAAFLGRKGIAEELLSLGAKVNQRDNNGLTALHFAALANLPEMVELLIGAGANLEAKTEAGFTPLSLAAAKKNFAAARILIASGADVNARISNSLNPLTLAEGNKDDSLSGMLKNNGAHGILFPWFNQATFGGHFTFNGDDMFTGLNLGLSDRKYNVWISLKYEVRPKTIRVLEPAQGNNYFQYWERRHVISFTLDKAFLLKKKHGKIQSGLVAGFSEAMTFSGYRGSSLGSPPRMLIIPHAGMVFQTSSLRFRLNYAYMDLHLIGTGRSWCSISIELLFNRKKGNFKESSISAL
jgi:uncharacterized protein